MWRRAWIDTARIVPVEFSGRGHHVGHYPELEGQMLAWVTGMDSPDRMDAAVYGPTELAGAGQLDVLAQGMDDNRLSGRR
ncbi:hypothetical protein ACIOGZ_26275 [Kitasatospora sp. NPDC088160]|uniref:hypothetical protein n=1 Tax=Kitasatospora sp. NPDC088160 TaxID=3364072 RepID=UPI0038258894